MQFITAFNQFWRIRQDEELTSAEVNLFFTILHYINNARGEDNNLLKVEVAIGNPRLMLLSGIPIRSITRVRNALRQKGFIDFESGTGKGHYAIYKLGAKFRNLVSHDQVNDQVNDQVTSNLVSHDQVNDQVNDQVTSNLVSHDQVNDQQNDQRSKSIEYREIKKEIYKERKKKIPQEAEPREYDPDEDVPTELYRKIENRFGKFSIPVFKKNKVPLFFVQWVVEVKKIDLRRLRNPVTYICALSSDENLFGEFNAWLAQEHKKSWKEVVSWR